MGAGRKVVSMSGKSDGDGGEWTSWRVGALLLSGLGSALLPWGWGVCFRLSEAAGAAGGELLCEPDASLSLAGRLDWLGSELYTDQEGPRTLIALALAMSLVSVGLVLVSVIAGAKGKIIIGGPQLIRLSVVFRIILLGAASFMTAYEGWTGGRASLPRQATDLLKEDLVVKMDGASFRVWGWLLAALFLYLALMATLAESCSFFEKSSHEESQKLRRGRKSGQRHRRRRPSSSGRSGHEQSRRNRTQSGHRRTHRRSESRHAYPPDSLSPLEISRAPPKRRAPLPPPPPSPPVSLLPDPYYAQPSIRSPVKPSISLNPFPNPALHPPMSTFHRPPSVRSQTFPDPPLRSSLNFSEPYQPSPYPFDHERQEPKGHVERSSSALSSEGVSSDSFEVSLPPLDPPSLQPPSSNSSYHSRLHERYRRC